MSDTTISYHQSDHVARITLNRPETDNAINQQLAWELADIGCRINGDDDVHVVVITSAGDRAFSSGGSLPETAVPAPAKVVAGIDKPVIAAINGDALGPGLELALSCDIRLASSRARFGFPEVAAGAIPAGGGTQRLPRIIGRAQALELILTARIIDAGEALSMGLVGRVLPPEKLIEETAALAADIAAKAPVAVRYIKEAVNKGLDLTLEQGLRLEADLYFLLHSTADRREGIKAYREKRPARFRGK